MKNTKENVRNKQQTVKDNDNENSKKRKITRKKATGSKIPKFFINGNDYYLSLYDIRNFLSDLENGDRLKYDLRKKYQNLERNQPEKRLVIEQKEILKLMDIKYKVHLNPNKKNVFLNYDQLLTEDFKYLKEEHNIESIIDPEFVITLENIPVIQNAKPVDSPNNYSKTNDPKKAKIDVIVNTKKKTNTKKTKKSTKKNVPPPKKSNITTIKILTPNPQPSNPILSPIVKKNNTSNLHYNIQSNNQLSQTHLQQFTQQTNNNFNIQQTNVINNQDSSFISNFITEPITVDLPEFIKKDVFLSSTKTIPVDDPIYDFPIHDTTSEINNSSIQSDPNLFSEEIDYIFELQLDMPNSK